MPKSPVTSPLHDPISAILGTRGKVAVLRVLSQAPSVLSQREVARRTGMALRTVELALDDLLATGIVERVEGGRERLVRVRTGHRLAPAILGVLRAGDDHWPALRGELRAAAASSRDPGLLAVAVIGRAARREERLGESVDLLVIAETASGAEEWVGRYSGMSDGLEARFGARLRVIGYDLAEARQMWAVRTSTAERSVREAELLHGQPVMQLVEAEAHSNS
jgi:DNA-binding transcriptional ArsR family regulator